MSRPLNETVDAGCTHCGLPVVGARVAAGAVPRFCCGGCEAAHGLIVEHGLGAYYELRDDEAPGATRLGQAAVDYADFDRPEFLERYAHSDDGARTVTLALEGIHCAACVWLLENLPRLCEGAQRARVDWTQRTITVTWRDDATSLSKIAGAIDRLGYRPHPLRGDIRADIEQRQERELLTRLAVAGAAAGNNMLIAGALYLGLGSYMSAPVHGFLRLASCIVGLVAILGPGRVFFTGAWAAARARVPHMDLPIALGLGAGALAGVWHTIRGTGEIYFDTLSVLVFLLLLGRWVQYRQQRRAASSVSLLARMTPRVAHRVVDGRVVDVPSEVLQPGDTIEVRATETFPADGRVVAGTSTMDQSLLTGESRPVALGTDGEATAGAVNLSAAIRLRVEATGTDTRIGKVLHMVEHAASDRPRLVALADRIGARFVVAVVVLATLTGVAWATVTPAVALDRAITLLIVACPCALALATPLTLAVALGRAARRRILIKGADVLERLAEPGTMWLDKTGTLTQGHVHVRGVVGPEHVRPLVAALERQSAHPAALALASAFDDPSVATLRVAGVEQSAGGGIRGTVDGHDVAVGNEGFVRRTAAAIAVSLREAAERFVDDGGSPVFVAVDGVVVMVAAVGDRLRDDARATVQALQAEGFEVGILSGDHPHLVAAAGRELGLDPARCHGGLTPEDKVAFVRRAAKRGPVVMVGDGVNDSAALAAADVSIATRDGAEASLQAAAVYLGQPGLSGVLQLLHLSQRALTTIRRTFGVSLAYNVVCVGLAMAGVITPLWAAVLMPLSSLSVVATAIAGARMPPATEASP